MFTGCFIMDIPELKQMEIEKRILIVGGTGRNVGKTEFICRTIEMVSANSPIIAIKFSNISPESMKFHGSHSNYIPGIFVEENSLSQKDTSRMLRAGAEKVYFVQGETDVDAVKIVNLVKSFDCHKAIIIESGSLWKYMPEAYFIVVHNPELEVKPSAETLFKKASRIIQSDGRNGFSELVRFSPETGWITI